MEFLVAFINNSLQPARRAGGWNLLAEHSPAQMATLPGPVDENPPVALQPYRNATDNTNASIPTRATPRPENPESHFPSTPAVEQMIAEGAPPSPHPAISGLPDAVAAVPGMPPDQVPTPLHPPAEARQISAPPTTRKLAPAGQQASRPLQHTQLPMAHHAETAMLEAAPNGDQPEHAWTVTPPADVSQLANPAITPQVTGHSGVLAGTSRTMQARRAQGAQPQAGSNQAQVHLPLADWLAATKPQEVLLATQDARIHHAKPASKPAEIPQVRIGHIDVLIGSQPAAKPGCSASPTVARPSNPFGFRGL